MTNILTQIISGRSPSSRQRRIRIFNSGLALDSFSFGLRLTVHDNEWQLGVNFILKPQEASNEIIHLFEDVTDVERATILKFKHILLEDRGIKVSSAFIYRAVLEQHISELDELLAYLEGIGYTQLE